MTRQIQPINKTIGINKLGTLLSSQTTDTPGTTQTNIQDRSGATFQTYPTHRNFANPHSCEPEFQKVSPTQTGALRARHFQAVISGVWPLFFRFSGGDSENNTRPEARPQIQSPAPPRPPKLL
ncbi:hypothetical protein ACLH0K_16980 [Arthrobacter sp. MPF02]|uniref:hypothetical protein n=1 Tax=Arthrobacter sp. MPF02 TaxID=3388492 RepID=UPI0039853FCD